MKHKTLGTKYYKNKPESVRRHNFKSNFGITVETYDKLLEKQNGCCAVCNQHESAFNRKLAIDHDAVTGEIRGLLCDSCNRFLIANHRSQDIFLKAATYIVGPFTGLFVPKKGFK